jgi:hypothetical protein
MSLPRPFPGLVIRYAYLWADQAAAGAEEGRKDRPCVIIVAAIRQPDGRIRCRVLPITHALPAAGLGVPIPPKVKRHLGMDAEASWVILSESNEFLWPGPDLRPVVRGRPGVWSYGVLPGEVFADIQEALRRLGSLRRVMRPEG